MPPQVIHSLTVPWVPAAHTMELVLADTLPDDYDVTTAFVFALDNARRVLLARVDRPGRGWDVPGGHVEDGESPQTAAARELAEETGLLADVRDLALVGGQRITLLADPPSDYRYPTRAYMAFYALRLGTPGPPTEPAPGSECAEAAWFAAPDVRRHCAGAVWLPLCEAVAGRAR